MLVWGVWDLMWVLILNFVVIYWVSLETVNIKLSGNWSSLDVSSTLPLTSFNERICLIVSVSGYHIMIKCSGAMRLSCIINLGIINTNSTTVRLWIFSTSLITIIDCWSKRTWYNCVTYTQNYNTNYIRLISITYKN